jgi:hypothetical protein
MLNKSFNSNRIDADFVDNEIAFEKINLNKKFHEEPKNQKIVKSIDII